MKQILLILLILSTAGFLFGQHDSVKVYFQVLTPNGNDSTKIYITGNHVKLGRWNPGVTPLEKISSGLWQKEIYFPVGENLEFKFTRGSWDTEALDSNLVVPPNYSLTVSKDTALSFTIEIWMDEVESLQGFDGGITGTVRYHRNITWHGLAPRDVIVWLPPGYDTDTAQAYPVLYMHDGQNIIDASTSTFGVDWQVDEAADSLIRIGEIKTLIIVGIYNTKNRSAEYHPGDTSDVYKRFIVNGVKPMIDSTYRTKPDRKNTGTCGSSSGGMISFTLAWEYADVFSKTICFSPAFKISDEELKVNIDYVDDVQDYSGPKKDLQIYIYNGGAGLEKDLQPGIDEMLKALQQKGYQLNRDLFWVKDENASHTEADWAKHFPEALKKLYKN